MFAYVHHDVLVHAPKTDLITQNPREEELLLSIVVAQHVH